MIASCVRRTPLVASATLSERLKTNAYVKLELLQKTPRAVAVVERVAEMANWGKAREGRGLGIAFIDYSGSQVAGIAEVSVDRASGQIKVHNFWCAIDCGVAVQPDNVVAQTESSIGTWRTPAALTASQNIPSAQLALPIVPQAISSP